MDKQRLIAEIRKRPALWDLQSEKYKSSRSILPQVWQDVAKCLGENVKAEECKRQWRSLRDAYRGIMRRIEKDILTDMYDPSRDYHSKWIYFDQMKFMKNTGRSKRNNASSIGTYESEEFTEADEFEELQQELDVKMNAVTSLQDAQFSLINGKKSGVIVNQENQNENTCRPIPMVVINREVFTTQSIAQNKLSYSYCNCPKRSSDEMDFSEDLKKDEQHLIKAARLDTSSSNDVAHFENSDYNFLISFLPQLKTMNELQNLQFRAKLTKCALAIMSQSLTNTK